MRIVVRLLSLEALEVGILPGADLILLKVRKYRLFRHLLGVSVDVAVARLFLWCLVDCLHMRMLLRFVLILLAARCHVVVVVLWNLLIAIDHLVELHLAV